ncbi:hypothetical protein KY343_04270 [Candidatus Woesearchaeota archaeon]|nr:hypothetical protein [Candidatus Woesearchaeota archaeon]
MSLVYLVGTVHWDLRGPERLRKFLGFVRPTSIGIEASQELIDSRLKFRKRVKAKLEEIRRSEELFSNLYDSLNLKKPEPKEDLVLKFLEIQSYEQWVPYEHKQEENPNVKIYPVHDNGFLSKRSPEVHRKELGEEYIDENGDAKLKFLEDLGKENLEEFQKEIDEAYRNNEFDYSKLIDVIKEADDIMEQKIREVVKADPNGIVAVVSGAAHFFSGYGNNLYERLQDLSPHRVKLPEVDQFK